MYRQKKENDEYFLLYCLYTIMTKINIYFLYSMETCNNRTLLNSNRLFISHACCIVSNN